MGEKKLGSCPAFACMTGIEGNSGYLQEGISQRLYIAKDILCALISNADRHSQEGDCQSWNYEHLSQIAFQATNELLKQENL